MRRVERSREEKREGGAVAPPHVLGEGGLTLAGLAALVDSRDARIAASPDALERVRRARRTVDDIVARGAVVYGITTGFGKLAGTRIGAQDIERLQRNLILSHSTGVGPPLSERETRAMLVLRANALLRGFSGVTERLVASLLALFNARVTPLVPEQGSVGASGDLAPLAHLALGLIGEGESSYGGRLMASSEALAAAGLRPAVLQAKEGLALINGTQATAAIGGLALERARSLAKTADVAAAMTLEGAKGSLTAFDPRIQAVRPHPGHAEVAANVRALMAESEILESHANCGKVQDAYSLRCVPQVHGAIRDALRHAIEVTEREIDSVTDNPLVFADDGDVISGGNFHAEPIALVFDYAAIALTEMGNISERRIESLVNPDISGLPAFLAPNPGLNSGLMITQVVAAALASENKVLAHPASADTIPTSANKEDHVSMGTHAARKLRQIVDNVERIVAIEMMCAAQAIDFHAPLRPGRGVAAAWHAVRERVPKLGDDRVLAGDIESIRAAIRSGAILAAAERASGPLA